MGVFLSSSMPVVNAGGVKPFAAFLVAGIRCSLANPGLFHESGADTNFGFSGMLPRAEHPGYQSVPSCEKLSSSL